MSFENRVAAKLIVENYERSLPSAISIFVLSFVVMAYQYDSPTLGQKFLVLGILLALNSGVRGIVSYLALHNKISQYRFLPVIQGTLILNSILWGAVFCFDAWHSKTDGIERLMSLSLMFGLASAAPIALITTPIIQTFFYVTSLIGPAVIYSIRVADGSLPHDFAAIPAFIILFFLYYLSTSRKLHVMLTKSIESTLKLQLEQENLKITLVELRDTQNDLLNERGRALNSERLAFLGSMASGVAHEINNPLTISGGQVFKIQNLLANEPTWEAFYKIGIYLNKITDMNVRIRNIVRGLQYFARERHNEAPEIFSLDELMDFSVIFFKEKMSKHFIEFSIGRAPAISIHGQKNELSQALFNIVDNAIEAVQGVETKNIDIRYEIVGDRIQIFVTDNGPGINATIKDRVFDPFFTTKEVGEGTGLGLSVARGIAQSHGGDIQFSSSPARTEFVLSLPIVKAQDSVGVA